MIWTATQASLPVKDGGMGIPSVGLLEPSAFLASAAATQDQARSHGGAFWGRAPPLKLSAPPLKIQK